jgi:hypothetical protein
MVVRVPRALLVLAAGLTIGLVALAATWRPAEPVPSGAGASAPAPAARESALAALHDWDVRRSAAWATGDLDALARLYVGRSRAGAADLDLLRRYTARGLVVRGLAMQVLRARVLVARPRLLELEVTDRLAGAVAVRADDPRSARRLPAGAATTRRLVLRRPADQWVVVRVSAPPGR